MGSKNSLLEFMNCERLDTNLFRGESRDFKTGQVFGGQVLGQAIKAAQETIDEGRSIHSAHAYFLRRGDVNAPIIYDVDRNRDGRSFSSRRVLAIQHGKPIFTLSASFQIPEQGYEFYREVALPRDALMRSIEEKRAPMSAFQSEFLDIFWLNEDEKSDQNSIQLWIKTKQPIPQDQDAHCAVLAYISDIGLLSASFLPHVDRPSLAGRTQENLIVASIDHSIWYHRPFRADDWFFYDCRAESTGNSRGFSHGRVYSCDGRLVASTSQEGLIRVKQA